MFEIPKEALETIPTTHSLVFWLHFYHANDGGTYVVWGAFSNFNYSNMVVQRQEKN